MLGKIKRNIFLVLGFSIIIYFVLIIYSDAELVLETFQKFPIPVFLEALFFIIISILLKYYRWHVYITELKIILDFKYSFLVFLSGLIMSISPGKIGELLKAYLLKERFKIPKSKTFPIILAERISEFFSLIIIVVFGITIYNFDSGNLFIPIVVIATVFMLSLNKNIKNKFLELLSRSSYLKNRINKIDIFHNSITHLFKPVIFLRIQIISLLTWISEFYAFYLIICSFNEHFNFYFLSFIYSISMVIGAVSMFPGGIGTTEASLVYQLVQNGITKSDAFTSTIVIRIITLWFSVAVGFFAYLIFLKKTKKNDNFF